MRNILRITSVLCIVLFVGCNSDDEATNNTPANENEVVITKLKASRISGPAPLAVQFSAIETTHADNSLDTFRELGYHFTFNDPTSGLWKHSGEPKNSQIGGPIASHIFETAGKYTVKVRAQDSKGNFSDESIVITVTPTNEVYVGANTVVISNNIDTTGAPDGAILLTNQTNWPQWESGKRYLLMSGQNFTSFGSINLKQVQDVQIGKNGSGLNPIVGEINIERGPPSITNWAARIAVLDLDSQAINIPNSAEDIYIIRGTNTSFYVGDTVEHYVINGTSSQSDSMRYPWNIFMYEATNTAPTTGFNSWVLSTGFNMLGTELANPSQHNIRPRYAVNTFIGHNLFYNAGSAQHNIKLHSGGILPNENEILTKNSINSASRWIVVANNTLGDGSTQNNPWSITFDPQNPQSEEGIQDVIVENNVFNFDYVVETVFGGRRLTERGNTSIGIYRAITGQNVNALPPSWDGPYYLDAQQVIPNKPGS